MDAGVSPDLGLVGVVLVGVAMVVGIVGTVLPFIPGLLLVWAAALVYGLVSGFEPVGIVLFVVITLLAIVGKVLSIVLPGRRGSSAGAPLSTLAVGLTGAVVGFFVIPVVGLIVGGIAGILIAEFVRLGDGRAAWATTKAVLVGFGIGALVEATAGALMMLVWVVWVLVT